MGKLSRRGEQKMIITLSAAIVSWAAVGIILHMRNRSKLEEMRLRLELAEINAASANDNLFHVVTMMIDAGLLQRADVGEERTLN